MKTKILYSLLLILFVATFTACKDDIPGSLNGTTWKWSLSGKEALMELDIPENTNTSITYSLTIQFTSEANVSVHQILEGIIDGESVDESDWASGTYAYNAETGDVIICIEEDCIDGIISGNKLKLTVEGESITLTKK